MNSKKSSNKITDIVRLQQILKRWKKLAINGHQKSTPRSSISTTRSSNDNMMDTAGGSIANDTITTASNSQSGRNINKFLKKTLSFSESSSSFSSDVGLVPKGYLAVCVGKELKRFVIPMEYLDHQAFALLLREAEEEFGFQQEGVLKIPCQVPIFENILTMMELDNKRASAMFRFHDNSGGDRDREKSDVIIHNGATNNVNASGAALGYHYSHHSPPDCEQDHRHQQQPPPQMCR